VVARPEASGRGYNRLHSATLAVRRSDSRFAQLLAFRRSDPRITIHLPQSTFHNPPSTLHPPLSTFHPPLSTLHHPLSTPLSKTFIIARSEYLRRLKSKGFIIATVLAPVLLLLTFGIAIGVGVLSQTETARALAILDETGVLGDDLAAALPDEYAVSLTRLPADTLRQQVRRGELDGFIWLPEGVLTREATPTYFSATGVGPSTQVRMQSAVNETVRRERLRQAGAPPEVLRALDERTGLRMVTITDAGEAADATLLFAGLGYIMGLVIYIAMFIYGAMVMRGVIEEKANRIVEVVISSARPFDLMMGKVLGIGAVGLTQFAIWGLLAVAALVVAGPLVAMFLDPATLNLPEGVSQEEMMQAAGLDALRMPPVSIFVYFVLFFIGGYLLYSGMFAAIGSAVDQESDAQSLQVPITIPIVIPMLVLPFVVDNPDAPLSVALSLIPFFSPILMVVRAAITVVPFWQIALSLVLLAGGFALTIWLAARIYRVGILMYGKKASFRDIARWVRYA
jgi:ABC-2 type transport system permease protein